MACTQRLVQVTEPALLRHKAGDVIDDTERPPEHDSCARSPRNDCRVIIQGKCTALVGVCVFTIVVTVVGAEDAALIFIVVDTEAASVVAGWRRQFCCCHRR